MKQGDAIKPMQRHRRDRRPYPYGTRLSGHRAYGAHGHRLGPAILVPIPCRLAIARHEGAHEDHDARIMTIMIMTPWRRRRRSASRARPCRSRPHPSTKRSAPICRAAAVLVKPKTIATPTAAAGLSRGDHACGVSRRGLTRLYATLGDMRSLACWRSRSHAGHRRRRHPAGHHHACRRPARQIGALRALGIPRRSIVVIVWANCSCCLPPGAALGIAGGYGAATGDLGASDGAHSGAPAVEFAARPVAGARHWALRGTDLAGAGAGRPALHPAEPCAPDRGFAAGISTLTRISTVKTCPGPATYSKSQPQAVVAIEKSRAWKYPQSELT